MKRSWCDRVIHINLYRYLLTTMGLKKTNNRKVLNNINTDSKVIVVHKAHVLSYADVMANRSKAYNFLTL